jgi:predicted MFS family arabinose efflux permease
LSLLALGRFLIGVGMAGVLMGSMKIFSQWFSLRRFATASGLLVGIGALGALAAASPLAWLNQLIGWRAVFLIGAIGTAVVAASIMIWTRNTPPGVPWTGGSATIGGFGVVFGDRRFWRMVPLAFFLAGVTMGFQGLWAGPYLFDVNGLKQIEAGNVLLWMAVGLALGFLASGQLADRFGIALVTVIATVVFAFSQFALAVQPPLQWVMILYAIFGFTGAFNIMIVTQARQIFPIQITGKAITAINVFAIGGTFLLQWWMGVIIGLFPTTAPGSYPPQAYSTALLFTGIGTTLTLIWYLPMLRQERVQRAKLSINGVENSVEETMETKVENA